MGASRLGLRIAFGFGMVFTGLAIVDWLQRLSSLLGALGLLLVGLPMVVLGLMISQS